uniref:Exosome complex component CSL4 C-terminal domain-containing protein n=1 Tax=Grammatophora oceanica TaxID=210454 RepID=A0A7S1VC51_9STRA
MVLCRVERLQLGQATVEMIAAEYPIGVLGVPQQGSIRREDVRKQASEEILMQDAMRPGDIVLCRILGMGDARRYMLSTAEVELGVVRATSVSSGKPMVPISWKEMQCPETGVKESRKCAKRSNLKEMILGQKAA